MFGTALVASGAAALNQLLEREYDAKMRRTANRPLPSGRLQPVTVMLFGGVCSLAGLVYLALLVNPLTSVLGAVSLVSYLFIYTPLKRMTWLNTAVGAVPGALPPLMGWAAARGELTGGGWALFAILAFWQMPHFFAIAWIYKDEYAKAGFQMLPGGGSGRQPHGPAIGESHAGAAAGELLSRSCFIWPGRSIWRARLCWGGVSVVRDPVCEAAGYAEREEAVFCFDHLPAAAADPAGGGQDQVNGIGD